jgi:hypothetical protein
VQGRIEEDLLHLDIDKLDLGNPDEIKALIRNLLNIIELQAQLIKGLKEENQLLRDEIAYLKGEKGKPKIPPNVPVSSENPSIDIDKPKKWKKGFRKPKIKVDRIERLYVDRSILPADAVRHGFRRVIKQDIKLETDNVEYQLEQYYSPSRKKIYEAELPEDVKHSTYGSSLKALIISLHYAGRVTQNKIQRILEDIVTGGLKVSNNGGIKMSTCQSLGVKTRGNVDVKHGGVPHVARFIQRRTEHQRDRQTDWTQPCDGAEISELSSSPFTPEKSQETKQA